MEPQAPPPLQGSTGLSTIQITILVVAILTLGVALWVAAITKAGKQQQKAMPALTSEQRAEALTMKNKACTNVERLKRAGGFTKIEAGYSGITHAYVDRSFFSIPVDAKESTMKWVALCYIDVDKKGQMGIVIIHNGYSGKRIGTFDFASGIEME